MSLVDEALEDVETLFLDTAPIIYFVEGKEPFVNIARPIFQKLSKNYSFFS